MELSDAHEGFDREQGREGIGPGAARQRKVGCRGVGRHGCCACRRALFGADPQLPDAAGPHAGKVWLEAAPARALDRAHVQFRETDPSPWFPWRQAPCWPARKFVAAMFTGSLGILSEAIHSLIDFGATIVTYFAIRWGDQPADDEHHYGHAKIESIAALVETGLLFLTTGWIGWEAIRRLLGDESPRGRGHLVGGRHHRRLDHHRLQPGARAASGWRKRPPARRWRPMRCTSPPTCGVRIVVLGGLGAVWAGVPAADSIAALVVSAFIAHAGWQLGARTMNTLLDAAPGGCHRDRARPGQRRPRRAGHQVDPAAARGRHHVHLHRRRGGPHHADRRDRPDQGRDHRRGAGPLPQCRHHGDGQPGGARQRDACSRRSC